MNEADQLSIEQSTSVTPNTVAATVVATVPDGVPISIVTVMVTVTAHAAYLRVGQRPADVLPIKTVPVIVQIEYGRDD